MLIHINLEEFEKDFQEPWKAQLIKSPSIDYYTNSIHGWFYGRDVIIFKDYGFVNDNKSNTYDLSCGAAGITISITKPKQYYFV
tara:strand:- start:238 stop:489 length:252 start_codon:yes stop_codon:yes gene_type:complete